VSKAPRRFGKAFAPAGERLYLFSSSCRGARPHAQARTHALRLRTPKAFASRQAASTPSAFQQKDLRLGTAASTSRSMIKGRPPRLPHIFQSYSATLFFVTVCTLHRRRFPSLKTAQEALVVYGTRAISEFNVALGRYVIMPDHLHFFVRGDQNFVLGNWVKGLKRAILKAFPNEKGYSLW